MGRRLRRGDLRPVPTIEEAERELAAPDPYPRAESGEWPRHVSGSGAAVRASLEAMAGALGVEELMIVTIVHDHRARLRSYELLAEAFGRGWC